MSRCGETDSKDGPAGVREREFDAFRQLNEHHRILAGTVSHEIRNLCSAIRVAPGPC